MQRQEVGLWIYTGITQFDLSAEEFLKMYIYVSYDIPSTTITTIFLGITGHWNACSQPSALNKRYVSYSSLWLGYMSFGWYRCGYVVLNDKMNNIVNVVWRENKTCYLLGDYNIDILNYASHVHTA